MRLRKILVKAVKEVSENYGIPEEEIWNEVIPEIKKRVKI